ncbi:hypothetical protein DWY83_13745 [Coprobacillus sp. AF27-24BH]|nr:hypothetical protein DWY83_13745 [Coprobacillus sp. AF27-24BH]RGH48057.1 hypothetical protein DW863_13070 [Coprobacillus sp. AM37-9BH]RHQ17116.1 hypothetical protein DWZ13_13115 [Coprobacillus sp. AF29-3BH]
MKRLKKLFIMMMSLTVFLSLAYTQVCAYGYKVTLYTGNQGTINSQNKTSINVSKGQMVSLDLSQIELPQDSKYYVKGIRLSGHDSVDNLDPATFVVNGDLDYVVVYGVKGNQVAYTVRYVDENGKQLSEDTILYGNVGDKPVVAYKYIDSYIPQAYALTKTLVENEKENVFTFTYKPGETGEIIENTNIVTTVISTTPSTNANQGNNGTGNATGGTQNNDGDTTTAGDEDVPQGLVDLDDEDTPKSNISVNNKKNSSTPIYAGIAISLAAIVGIIVAFMTIRKKRV